MDLCSGGMIWSCCVDVAPPQSQNDEDDSSPQPGSLNNASKYSLPCFLYFHLTCAHFIYTLCTYNRE